MRHQTILLASAAIALCGPARAFALAATVDSIDELPEAIQAEYTQGADGKFHLQVTGMKPEGDVGRLQAALTKERTDHAALKTRISTIFGERKFEDIQADLDRLPELEAAAEGKLDDDKINAIVEGRVKTRIAPVERDLAAARADLATRDETIGELTAKDRTRTIHDAARVAATAAKMLPEAVDDFLLLADKIFEVRDDDGKVVVKDQVGYTPGIEPSVLLTDLTTKRPHWWGPSTGGGAGGQRGATGGATNPFTHANWNMTEQGKLINTDPAKADQLAKAAGHADALTARKPPAPAGK